MEEKKNKVESARNKTVYFFIGLEAVIRPEGGGCGFYKTLQ